MPLLPVSDASIDEDFYMDRSKPVTTDSYAEIRSLLERWVVFRDAGLWDRFAEVWHDDGVMHATWFQGPFGEFIDANRAGWAKGVRIFHFLGGSAVDVRGPRAVAQTKMSITQRAQVDGVECDVVCTGRFFDLFEQRDGRWGLVLRQPIYERDRIDPVVPGDRPRMDKGALEGLPAGYRHLAYLQIGLGYPVKLNMPQLEGPEIRALYEAGQEWLAGGSIQWR